MNFAFTETNENFLPVLLEIEFHGSLGLFQMKEGAYKDEDEILLQDGLEYMVTQRTVVKDPALSGPYHLIRLRYPCGAKLGDLRF